MILRCAMCPHGSSWAPLAPHCSPYGSSWPVMAPPGSSHGSAWLPPDSSWFLLALHGSSWLLLAHHGSSQGELGGAGARRSQEETGRSQVYLLHGRVARSPHAPPPRHLPPHRRACPTAPRPTPWVPLGPLRPP